MRGRVLFLLLLVLAAAPAWGRGPLPRYVEVRFRTYPPDATVTVVHSGGAEAGQSALHPVQVPGALAAAGFQVDVSHPWFETRRVDVLGRIDENGEVMATSEWPPKGDLPLEPASALLGVLAWARYHAVLAGSLGAGLAGVLVFGLVQGRRRRVAQARLDRLDALRARADMQDPLVANLTLLGRYRLVQRLGMGGMATVYRGVPDETLDEAESVALKVMRPELAADPEFRRRFDREYRVLARLSHPAVMRILDSGEQDGLVYLVVEFVDGQTLGRLVGRQALPVEEMLRWVRPLAQGLAYAHDQGVVHRDLKPENVMVTQRGALKIMDFGLARAGDMTQVTQTGQAMGTPAYMAPEQVLAGGGAPGPGIDQYALGVMIYEMLAGRRPFEETDTMAMVLRHVNDPPPPLREFRADLSFDLETVVLRMLEKDPAHRFASVRDALAALEDAAAGRPVALPPRPVGAAPEAGPPTRGVPTRPVPPGEVEATMPPSGGFVAGGDMDATLPPTRS